MDDNELNERLQPLNAPVANNQGAIPAYYFFLDNERHSITASKIKSIDFSGSITGTINIGGTANQYAQLVILNSSNNELGEIDNNGISLFGTTSLRYYDTALGTYIANFGPTGGTAFIQTYSNTTPLYVNLGAGAGTMVVNGNLSVGTAIATSATISTYLQGGTATNLAGTLTQPVLTGTPNITGTLHFNPSAATAALATNQFDIQTKSGSAVLVVNVGGTNFFFSSSGTF